MEKHKTKDDLELSSFISEIDSDNPPHIEFTSDCGYQPRYYQINAVLNFNAYIKAGFRRILCVSPTGTGKTLISKLLATSVDIRNSLGLGHKKKIRVLFVADDVILLEEAKKEFEDVSDTVELITQSAYSKIPQKVLDDGWDITFMDEAHHEAMSSMQKILEYVGDRALFGLTATPNRGDGLLLKFERFVYLITKIEAIRRKFIATPTFYSISDTSGKDKVNFTIDFIENNGDLIGNTLIYFLTVGECERFYEWAISRGHSAYLLKNKDEAEDIKERFSKGEFKFLINCKMLGEGVDIKNCSYTILARRFESAAEKEQYIGRTIRSDSPCFVFEFILPLEKNVLGTDLFPLYHKNVLIHKRYGKWSRELIHSMEPSEIYTLDNFKNKDNADGEIEAYATA